MSDHDVRRGPTRRAFLTGLGAGAVAAAAGAPGLLWASAGTAEADVASPTGGVPVNDTYFGRIFPQL